MVLVVVQVYQCSLCWIVHQVAGVGTDLVNWYELSLIAVQYTNSLQNTCMHPRVHTGLLILTRQKTLYYVHTITQWCSGGPNGTAGALMIPSSTY